MIKVNGSLIDERQIIGIGPIIRLLNDLKKTVQLSYDIYLIHRNLNVTTDELSIWSEREKSQSQPVFDKFRKEWHALYNAIQAGDIEAYQTYCNLVAQEAKQQKENPQA